MKNKRCGLLVSLLLMGFALTSVGAQEKSPLFEQGEKVYGANCASCHRGNGQGLPNVFPSLVNNEFVTGEPQPVIQIILEGRRGAMGRMPGWQTRLQDQEIAAVASFIRQHWGNQAGAVTPEMVAAQRR